MIDAEKFLSRQLETWTTARDNYAALGDVAVRELPCGIRVQFNPARMVSTGAKMDADTLKTRKCFLCRSNRPIQQTCIDCGDYEFLVNPFPIFPRHFTIPTKTHTDQGLRGRIADMARFARELPGYTVFYNGPHCGASAPDHAHFQAGNSDFLPIWDAIGDFPCDAATALGVFGEMGVIAFKSTDISLIGKFFERLCGMLPPDTDEPMLNALMRSDGDEFTMVVIPRKRHRPSFYGTGEGQMVVSPASVDLGGVFITPRKEDFDTIDCTTVAKIIDELCYSPSEVQAIVRDMGVRPEPKVSVGIMAEKQLELTLHGDYICDGDRISGKMSLNARSVKEPIELIPADGDAYVEVDDVMIGINFHWQQRETQSFKGAFKILKDEGKLLLINILPVEDYLTSVISSEMSATSSMELLKAHAVISRSWVLAQIRGKGVKAYKEPATEEHAGDSLVERRIVWYDHDDHQMFDVCADDHCQRYQGITRASTEAVREAVEATRGEVLMSGDELCDARFSKCCGGVMEQFESCWADTPKSYLLARRDYTDPMDFPDLRIEENAVRWITTKPAAFCNTTDSRVLRQVLNTYDQTTTDFYRWEVTYDTDTLSDLVKRKTGIDFGTITDLQPVKRGVSGRIVELRIVGSKLVMDIGKELEIRRALSETHLYSSSFTVERTEGGFRLRGAGWGHGVGLCQIGAAMMAEKGYGYRDILAHYYPGSRIDKIH